MLEIKTNKEVAISVHDDSTAKLCWKFNYKRMTSDELILRVDCYAIGENESLTLLPQGCKTEKLSGEPLIGLMVASKELTPVIDNSLEYMDNLIATGIKIVLSTQGYWQSALNMDDFE